MSEIRWGIIGCGAVTEVKSGPAFNKVPDSFLLAVMRRDAAKAEDYARRHDVPHWYSDADQIINNPKINAVYVATPPSSHEDYVIKIIDSGKHVYVEKPMSLDYASAKRMADYAAEKNVKLCVAHYRRQQPVFLKIKELLASGVIGQPLTAELKYYRKPLSPENLQGLALPGGLIIVFPAVVCFMILRHINLIWPTTFLETLFLQKACHLIKAICILQTT
jgi:predicted dehydrogenase